METNRTERMVYRDATPIATQAIVVRAGYGELTGLAEFIKSKDIELIYTKVAQPHYKLIVKEVADDRNEGVEK